jgi:hypothetical protein
LPGQVHESLPINKGCSEEGRFLTLDDGQRSAPGNARFGCGQNHLADMRRNNSMKNDKRLIFVGVAFLVFLAGTMAAPETVAEISCGEVKFVAYYFHGTFRCPSCTKIEKWSYEAIRKSFPTALEEGRLLWKPVNLEEAENKHFVEQYSLFTKSLIITEVKGEKEMRWKNLNRVWELLGNQQKFFSYVTQEVRDYLEH